MDLVVGVGYLCGVHHHNYIKEVEPLCSLRMCMVDPPVVPLVDPQGVLCVKGGATAVIVCRLPDPLHLRLLAMVADLLPLGGEVLLLL